MLDFTWYDVWELHCCFMHNDMEECIVKYDAIVFSLWCLGVWIIYSFVWSIVGNNCSKVDQIWSITPWLYSWGFYWHFHLSTAGSMHPRLLLVCILMTLWGVRLTYNFWRRGGYGNLISHEEDYRWPILRKKMNAWTFLLFNLTFIATYQNILLMLIALPTYMVLYAESTQISFLDILLTFLFMCLLSIETIADQQHYDFQEYKHSLSEREKRQHKSPSIRSGFLQSGLWGLCRHPNYFAEQMIWVTFYLFAVSATGELFNWSGIGVVLLVILFQGSMAFGESITAAKYPLYKKYQQGVWQCIPCVYFKFNGGKA
mmetsp:Transcript_9025/g.13563  ORF Transcript_9025/g.13563 Transcript_9025/m.13563 type:complete len:315 (-) Transcript_9025:98-1042(-)